MSHLHKKDGNVTAFHRPCHPQRICEIDTEQMRGGPEGSKKITPQPLITIFLLTGGGSESLI